MEVNHKTSNEATPLTVTTEVKDTSNVAERDDAITSTTPDKFSESMEVDAEFFAAAELGIGHVSPEKITENVEDIVQDLENLLGESSDTSYSFVKDNRLVESSSEINSSVKYNPLDFEDDLNALHQATVSNSECSIQNKTIDEQLFQTTEDLQTEAGQCQAFLKSDSEGPIHGDEIQINEVSTDTNVHKEAVCETSAEKDIRFLNDEFELFQSTLTRRFCAGKAPQNEGTEASTSAVSVKSPVMLERDCEASNMPSVAVPDLMQAKLTTDVEDTITTTYETTAQITSEETSLQSEDTSNNVHAAELDTNNEPLINSNNAIVTEVANSEILNQLETSDCQQSELVLSTNLSNEMDCNIQLLPETIVNDQSPEEERTCVSAEIEEFRDALITNSSSDQANDPSATNIVEEVDKLEITEAIPVHTKMHEEIQLATENNTVVLAQASADDDINSDTDDIDGRLEATEAIPVHTEITEEIQLTTENNAVVLTQASTDDDINSNTDDIDVSNKIILPSIPPDNEITLAESSEGNSQLPLPIDVNNIIVTDEVNYPQGENSPTIHNTLIPIEDSGETQPNVCMSNSDSYMDDIFTSNNGVLGEEVIPEVATIAVASYDAQSEDGSQVVEADTDNSELKQILDAEFTKIELEIETVPSVLPNIFKNEIDLVIADEIEETPVQSLENVEDKLVPEENGEYAEVCSVPIVKTSLSDEINIPMTILPALDMPAISIESAPDQESSCEQTYDRDEIISLKGASNVADIPNEEQSQQINTEAFEQYSSETVYESTEQHITESDEVADENLEVIAETDDKMETVTAIDSESDVLPSDVNEAAACDDNTISNDFEPVSISTDSVLFNTLETGIAVSSIIPIEQIPDHIDDGNNTVMTESASAVEALISSELSSNIVHSDVIEYDVGFDSLSQYKPSFVTAVAPTPKIFEPSALELNCAVASILGESTNSVISELEYAVSTVDNVSTPSEVQVVDLQEGSYAVTPVTFEQSTDNVLEIQVDSDNTSQPPTSYSITDTVLERKEVEDLSLESNSRNEQQVENVVSDDADKTEQVEIVVSVDMSVDAINKSEENTAIPVNLGQPLRVEIEDDVSKINDNKVVNTPTEKNETEHEILSPESQKNMSSLKITFGKDESSHSILKIYDPNEAHSHKEEAVIPKITIKPIPSPVELQPSPKLTIKPIKSPDAVTPKITIKEILKPEPISPIKITIRSKTTPTSPLVHTKAFTEFAEILHHSPKITIKPVLKPAEVGEESGIKKELAFESERLGVTLRSKSIESGDKVSEDNQGSPKLFIKPIKPPTVEEVPCIPKITIKPVLKPAENSEEGKTQIITSETSSKSPINKSEDEKSSCVPRITIKPVIKPVETNEEAEERRESFEHEHVGIKTRTKSVANVENGSGEKQISPKLIIKPIVKPFEDEEASSVPRITIKPIVKSPEMQFSEDRPKITIKPIKSPEPAHSPKITIKPIVKPEEQTFSEDKHTPRITIKPIIKPPDNEQASITSSVSSLSEHADFKDQTEASFSTHFKLNIKPVVKPDTSTLFTEDRNTQFRTDIESVSTVTSSSSNSNDNQEQTNPCIVEPVKLNRKSITKPPETSILQSFLSSGELPKKPIELIDFEDQIKQERIILKIAKPTRRGRPPLTQAGRVNPLKLKVDRNSFNTQGQMSSKRLSNEADPNVKHFKLDVSQGVSAAGDLSSMYGATEHKSTTILEQHLSQDQTLDPLSEIPVFEITPQLIASVSNAAPLVPGTSPPTPRKRGRPRKIPLQVREEFKDTVEGIVGDELSGVEEPIKPKRNCRGSSARSTPSKSRKGKGSRGRRGGGSPRATRSKVSKKSEESILPVESFGLFPEPMVTDCEQSESEVKDAQFKPAPLLTESGNNNTEVVIYEEETRMSAENSSRAQTPAKQVSSTDVIEESQSSVQSNATTESGEKTVKSRKGRSEVHHELEGEVLSPDKLAEYSWGGGGPYMLQEQVAQFLGIKSFKRKYPGIERRPVDMQERDFIRESGLASEAMCDMGLTAVKSEDILDIMYTDFQHKYEEYCKYQRDRQAKDVSNKQKALSLAASQEKNKMDIVEQAVQSAQQWNANFNKTRRQQRRACMDLQTFTVHYPKGKMKQINKPPMGNYPLSLVPGQYSDHYKKYTPRELSSLPLNTVGCGSNVDVEDSQSGSESDSDSSSSDSDSSSSGSSDNCKVCNTRSNVTKKQLVR